MGVIRLLLALAVVVGHSRGLAGLRDDAGVTMLLVTGRVAVQSFYMISGFYMALILDRVYTGAGSTKAFWLSRYMRLAPLYILISLLTLAFALDLDRFAGYSLSMLLAAAISHVMLVGQDIFVFFGYSPTLDDVKFLPDILQGGLSANPGYEPGWSLLMIEPGWSIGVEIWFYLLAPFLLRLSTRSIVFVLLLSVAVRIVLAQVLGWKDDPWTYRFFPSELAVFLLGSLSYRLYASGKFVIPKARDAVLLLLAIYAVILFFYFLPGGSREKRLLLFAILFFSLPTVFHLTKNWPVDRWIGELSYPTYLCHMLVIALLPQLGDAKGYAVVGITLAFSALLVIFVESPIDRYRHRVAERVMSKPRLNRRT